MSILAKKPVIVGQVFADDLERQFVLIRSALMRFLFLSIDTEFPGTIFKPDKQVIRKGNPLVNYQYMKSNVDVLKIIQFGLTLSDSQGNLPDFNTPFSYVWEFNFKDFDIDRNSYDTDSIELLKRQGIDFAKNKVEGIDSRDFTRMLWSSGLGLNPFGLRGTWVTFQGAYDFGYMVRILTQRPLPSDFRSFISHLAYFFGLNIFDLKHTFKFLGLHGDLEKISRILNVDRVAGSSHQAGSDSLLTLQCFMKLKMTNVFECNRKQRSRMLPRLALYGLVQTV